MLERRLLRRPWSRPAWLNRFPTPIIRFAYSVHKHIAYGKAFQRQRYGEFHPSTGSGIPAPYRSTGHAFAGMTKGVGCRMRYERRKAERSGCHPGWVGDGRCAVGADCGGGFARSAAKSGNCVAARADGVVAAFSRGAAAAGSTSGSAVDAEAAAGRAGVHAQLEVDPFAGGGDRLCGSRAGAAGCGCCDYFVIGRACEAPE